MLEMYLVEIDFEGYELFDGRNIFVDGPPTSHPLVIHLTDLEQGRKAGERNNGCWPRDLR